MTEKPQGLYKKFRVAGWLLVLGLTGFKHTALCFEGYCKLGCPAETARVLNAAKDPARHILCDPSDPDDLCAECHLFVVGATCPPDHVEQADCLGDGLSVCVNGMGHSGPHGFYPTPNANESGGEK